MTQERLHFTVERTSSTGAARAGTLQTAHSVIPTPVFMPVGTHAVVRGHGIETLSGIGYQMLLANTYHLLLRPGPEIFRQFGGIHRFMNWPHSILTDSGGYQVFSLAHSLKMSDEGVTFRSYVEGKQVLLTPERSIEMQRAINSDIMMVLDHCVSSVADRAQVKAAMDQTHAWASRSLQARGDSHQALFGIVQGGCLFDLRRESAAQITSLPFDGYAIGGVAVGEALDVRNSVVAYTAGLLPKDRPRYLMGVGTPIDLLESVAGGMDMFDCILPTALAQQGICFTSEGRIDIRRGRYRTSEDPLDPKCLCITCQNYSRAYLHHLLKIGEFQGGTLIGIHNLTFYHQLMSEMRSAILADSFDAYYQGKKSVLVANDNPYPALPTRKKVPRVSEELGNYLLYRHNDTISIRQKSSSEVMHSVSDPNTEAEKLYIEQSGFADRIRLNSNCPLVIWDVGLGAGTNAMAVIRKFEECAREYGNLAQVHLVSFENDLDSLKLALQHPNHFSHIRHRAPHAILKNGAWALNSHELQWTLLEGDFLQHMEEAPKPDLVFYDPFSYKADSSLWTLSCFTKLFHAMKPSGAEIFTYSASTSIRATLLAAGFSVARGVGTGPKNDTTIAISGDAARPESVRYQLLDAAWLQRWERSQNRFPFGMEADQEEEMSHRIREHPQFR